jgi:hypothetical protein
MRLAPRSAFHAFALIASLTVTCHCAARETKIPWKIDVPAAQRLAAEGDHGSAAGLGFFDYDSHDASFIVFNTISKPPANGGFGYFAVNARTGDVWALWGCHLLSTPALRKSQAAIRARFTRDELKHYAQLRRLKPECIVED